MIAAAGGVLAIALLPALFQIAREIFSSGAAIHLLASGRLWWLLSRSVALSAVVTAVSLGSGVPLGVLFAKAAFPLRRTLFAAHVAIVFLPPFLPALGWFQLFGPHGVLGGTQATRTLFSEAGLILVLTSCFAPIVTAFTALGVRGVDAGLEEAARIAGGPLRTAARILVPTAAPAITLAGIIVFALALSELGVPMFLRIDVYPAVVFARLGGMDFAPGEAAVFVLPLMIIALALLWVEHRYAGRRAIASLGRLGESRAPLFRPRLTLLAAAVVGAAVSSAPLLALAAHAASHRGFAELSSWVGDAPWNGLRSSALAAVGMCALALVLGRDFARRGRAGVWLDAVAVLAFIVPSPVLGVGMISAWNRPATNWLYTSYGILVLGFLARYSVVATRTFAASVAQLPDSLEEAARTMGAGYLRRLALLAQLAPRGLVAAFLLALMFALRDLETAALFYPPGGEPLTVRIFTLEANGPPGVVSALAVLHVAITFAAVGAGCLMLRFQRDT